MPIAVFGRLGSRPFTQDEQQKLYLNESGKPWFVTDEIDLDAFVEAVADLGLPPLPQEQAP